MPRRALNVAPTDGSTKFNTIRIPLIPVACWRLDDPAFDFDSSFVLPTFRGELVPTSTGNSSKNTSGSPLSNLRDIVGKYPGCVAALFGHCDPAGSDALNKTLGDRRAIAVYALVTRQPDLWDYLYDTPQVGDTWSLRMVQIMLANVEDGNGAGYYAGTPTGARDAATTDAVKRFQGDSGLDADGDPGPKTRHALFGAYMDWLCTPDGTLPPAAPDPSTDASQSPPNVPPRFSMQPTDFLGGTGAQPGDLPKMSLQSCGKYNPVLLLTSTEMGGEDTTDGASKTQRNADDAPNRRVVMFLFPKDTKVDSAAWPCPKVKETNDACKSAFWPDGDSRRKNGDTKREYKATRDTMACRFYDRFARRSPCESPSPVTLNIWLQDRDRQLMPNASYRLIAGSTTSEGKASDKALVTTTVYADVKVCTIEWGELSSDSGTSYRFRREINVEVNPANQTDRDLDNLAYYGAGGDDGLPAFSQDYPSGPTPDSVHRDGTPKNETA